MTITESVLWKISMFVLCALVFTACTTTGGASGERNPQSAARERP
ncbi:hypothetical protein [Bdellovibrio sp. HCB337]